MQEGISGTVGEFDKAEPFVRIIPLDGGPDRRAGGAVELGTAWRRISEIASRRLIVVIVEITATGWTKISGSAAHGDFLGGSNAPQSELEKRRSSTNSARSWCPEAPSWRG
jgi:hypothetical protein